MTADRPNQYGGITDPELLSITRPVPMVDPDWVEPPVEDPDAPLDHKPRTWDEFERQVWRTWKDMRKCKTIWELRMVWMRDTHLLGHKVMSRIFLYEEERDINKWLDKQGESPHWND